MLLQNRKKLQNANSKNVESVTFKYEFAFMIIMKLTVILEPQKEGGFTVYVPSLPGCISQGETKAEALKNIKEAIELYLEADTNELVIYSGEQVTVSV